MSFGSLPIIISRTAPPATNALPAKRVFCMAVFNKSIVASICSLEGSLPELSLINISSTIDSINLVSLLFILFPT